NPNTPNKFYSVSRSSSFTLASKCCLRASATSLGSCGGGSASPRTRPSDVLHRGLLVIVRPIRGKLANSTRLLLRLAPAGRLSLAAKVIAPVDLLIKTGRHRCSVESDYAVPSLSPRCCGAAIILTVFAEPLLYTSRWAPTPLMWRSLYRDGGSVPMNAA